MTIWARTQDPWGDNLQEAGEGPAGDGGQVLRLRQRTGGAKLKLFLKLSLDKKDIQLCTYAAGVCPQEAFMVSKYFLGDYITNQ